MVQAQHGWGGYPQPPPPADPRATALAAVRGPAIGLQVLAVLVALQVLGYGGLMIYEGVRSPPWEHGSSGDVFFFVLVSTGLCLALAGTVFVFVSGVRLRRLRGRKAATAAAIVLMLPCLSAYIWPFAVAVGIWVLVVVRRQDVFASMEGLPPP